MSPLTGLPGGSTSTTGTAPSDESTLRLQVASEARRRREPRSMFGPVCTAGGAGPWNVTLVLSELRESYDGTI